MSDREEQSKIIRRVLLEISDDLTKNDLESLKFMAELGEGQEENIETSTQFFKKIFDRFEDQNAALRYIISLLIEIKKNRLAGMLEKCSIRLHTNIEKPVHSYVERRQVHSELQSVLTSKQRIIAFIGPVGIGKTEMMKELCVKLEEKCLVIQAMEASSRSKFADILESISHIVSTVSSNGHSDIKCIIKTLRALGSTFVLSLDTSKVPHTSKFCSNAKMFIKEVHLIPNCKLILTSARFFCKNCHRKNGNATCIKVPYLNKRESADLLKKLNVNWDQKSTENIVNFCQGSPALLEHFSETTSLSEVFGRKLSHKCLHSFVSDEAFSSQLKNFSKDIKHIMVYLCQIKDEFPIALAHEILDIETRDVMNACEFLEKENMLIHRDGCYQVPQIIHCYVNHIIENDQELKSVAKKAKLAFIQLFVGFLYKMNELFIGYPQSDDCRLFNELLRDVTFDTDERQCARKVLLFYRKYENSFESALKQGVKNKNLKAVKFVADCANECVSFLAKAMERSTVINLYQNIAKCDQVTKSQICHASTLVSIAFLKIYQHGNQGESALPDEIIQMLKNALGILLYHNEDDNDCGNVHLQEIIAHCFSKLGYALATKYPESFDEGRKMMNVAIDIRKKEVEKGCGSQAMIAAGFVCIGEACRHTGRYEEAKKYLEKGLAIYRRELVMHPFIATTMNYLAEVYSESGNLQKSFLYALIAKNMSNCILGDHLDTARFIRGHADMVALTDKPRAKKLYDYAKEIGKHQMGKKELITMVLRCSELCDKEEADQLRKEATEIQRCISFDWNVYEKCNNPRPAKLNFFNKVTKYFISKPDLNRAQISFLFFLVILFGFYLYFSSGNFMDRCLCPSSTLRRLSEFITYV